jgi:Flp pilus assembly protein TadD
MTRSVVVALSAVCLVACVRQVQDPYVRIPQPPHTARTAVAEMMQRQIRNAVDAGDGDQHLAALRRRLAANPDDLPTRLELARAYVQAGFSDISLEHYRLAAQRYPDSAEVAILLAKSLRSMGLLSEARSSLRQFNEQSPKASAEAASWLAIFQDEAGDHAAAELSHRAALELQPGSDALHNNLGYNLLLQGRDQEAAAEFRKALDIAPRSVLARNNLGIALAGDPKDAVLHWQAVSDRASAHNNLAAILIEKGMLAEARRELQLALEYENNHPAALKNLQLLSELEGISIELRPPLGPAWRRFLRELKTVLVGD